MMLAICLMAFFDYRSATAMREQVETWHMVKATITKSDVLEIKSNEPVKYKLSLQYKYKHLNIEYFGEQLGIEESPSFDEKNEAQRHISKYPLNLKTKAFVNPSNPGQSVLLKNFLKSHNQPEFTRMLGIIAFIFGAVPFGLERRARRKEKLLHEMKAAQAKPKAPTPKNLSPEERMIQTMIQARELEGVTQYADQALSQYEQVTKIDDEIHKLLEAHMAITELTYQRFSNSTKKVVEEVHRNLVQVSQVFGSIQAVCSGHITERLKILEESQRQKQADIDEYNTLKERLSVRQGMVQKISDHLTKNEQALTSLTGFIQALGNMNNNLSPTQLAQTLDELGEMVDRTKKIAS